MVRGLKTKEYIESNLEASSESCEDDFTKTSSPSTNPDSDSINKDSMSGIEIYEEAVLIGYGYGQNLCSNSNSIISNTTLSPCESRYKGCSMSSDDIIHYFDILAKADMM